MRRITQYRIEARDFRAPGLIALALVLAGLAAACTAAPPAPVASTSPSASASATTTPTGTATASASVSATTSQAVLTSSPLQGGVAAASPWVAGTNPASFAVNTLLYVQGLAARAKLPASPKMLMYGEVPSGVSVLCNSHGSTPYASDSGQYDNHYGLRWCPDLDEFVVMPNAVVSGGNNPLFLQNAMDAYARGLTTTLGKMVRGDVGPSATGRLEGYQVLDMRYSACFHGVLLRKRVLENPSEFGAISTQLSQYYVDQLNNAYSGFTGAGCSFSGS